MGNVLFGIHPWLHTWVRVLLRIGCPEYLPFSGAYRRKTVRFYWFFETGNKAFPCCLSQFERHSRSLWRGGMVSGKRTSGCQILDGRQSADVGLGAAAGAW